MRAHLFAAALCACAPAAPPAFAGFVIDDRSFFDGIDHTLLDFETKGDGSPVDLPPLGAQLFSPTEYNNFGVDFESRDPHSFGMGWGNFPPPNPLCGICQSIGAVGSPVNVISGGNDWTMTFSVPVHAVGIGVVQGGWGVGGPSDDRRIMKDLQTRMRAFSADGTLLGEVFFWEDLVDGGFGGPWKDGFFGEEFLSNPFGFLGIVSPDTPIAQVEMTHGVPNGVLFDDLRFSALPAPGPGAALTLAALGMGLRRRR